MIRYILVLIFLWLLTACSPVHKLKRAEKLIEQAGELGAKWKVDTVKTTVEIPVPEIRFKEIVKVLPGETVEVTKDKTVVKIVRLPGDSILVDVYHPADTVYKEVPVTVTRTISAGYTKWQLIGSVLGGILFVGLMAFGAYKIAGLVKSSAKSG